MKYVILILGILAIQLVRCLFYIGHFSDKLIQVRHNLEFYVEAERAITLYSFVIIQFRLFVYKNNTDLLSRLDDVFYET